MMMPDKSSRVSALFLWKMNKTSLERAFEIARSGRCVDLSDLIKCLRQEGYETGQIVGNALKKQLLSLIEEAKSPRRDK
jgi:hypothetical protein